MTNTKLQRLQANRAKLLARLKTLQASQDPNLEEEEHLFFLLEANTTAIYKCRPPEPDLPRVICDDQTYHRPDDWLSID